MQINQFSYKHFYFEGPLLNYRLPTCYASNQNQPTSKNLLSVGFIIIYSCSLKGFESVSWQFNASNATMLPQPIPKIEMYFIYYVLIDFKHKRIIECKVNHFITVFLYKILHITVKNVVVLFWNMSQLLEKFVTFSFLKI